MSCILIVDDNVILRYTTAEWLRVKGYEIVEAASGDEAIVVLSSILKIDLVITDIEMPGSVDGYDLALHIQKKFPAMPIIMVSGRQSGHKAHEIGVPHFFRKPYDLQEIEARIVQLLPPSTNGNGKSGHRKSGS